MNSASHKHATAAGSSEREAIATEQDYVDGLFSRLDDEVAAANERLNEVQADVDPVSYTHLTLPTILLV